MTWNYRLCKKYVETSPVTMEKEAEGFDSFSVREVYYTDDGEPYTYTEPLTLNDYESGEEIRGALEMMLKDVTSRPVLDLDTTKMAPWPRPKLRLIRDALVNKIRGH